MMYYIAGSNLFGQWLCEDTIISKFRNFTALLEHSGCRADLEKINWSYIILKIDGHFYISGACDGKEQQLTKIPIPADCIDSDVEFKVIGNDYKLLLVGMNVNKIWVMDLNEKTDIKKVYLSVEEPISNTVKKRKCNHNITKVALTNDCCLYLTLEGNVYSGVLPSYVDTKYCIGKICDIQCGYEHFVLLTEEGRVYTWGNGRRLQLGHGDICNMELPTEVEGLAGIQIIKISAGGWHSLALSIFGDVYAWGWNDTGQLGIKKINKEDCESYSVPTLIDIFDDNEEEVDKNIKDIACGSRHSAIMLEDNSVWTTGCNKYGQLGFSEVNFPIVNHFKKAFHCDSYGSVMCGPWNTVIKVL